MLRCLVGLVLVLPAAAAPPTGFVPEVAVRKPTRLDWEFVASGFGALALKLPADYDSTRQRFQLYVPRTYDPKRAWPLVVFVSPGDAPVGWKNWQRACEDQGVLFCSPYAAGNSCPPGQRVRIVLDMFDQVRRDYRIDPERTYFGGFSGGGRVACTLAYNLPEFCGGVVPVCGTNPLPRHDYLRHRAQDRLSVALLTGETDFNRVENEKYMAPWLAELGVRSRLWVVPKMGHGVPAGPVMAEVLKWLEDDLKRRRADVAARPTLACPADDQLIAAALAGRMLEAAEAYLKDDARLWRGVTLLQGVQARWPRMEAAAKARKLIDELKENERRLQLAGEQGALEERTFLRTQAEALERFHQPEPALQAWRLLSQQYPTTPEGRQAIDAVRRLTGAVASTPFLGAGFEGESAVVERVLPGSPADKAGLEPGDRLRTLAGKKVASLDDVRKALGSHKPGDKLKVELDRKGKPHTLIVEVGALPSEP